MDLEAFHVRHRYWEALDHLYRAAAFDSAFTMPLLVAAVAHLNLGEYALADSIAEMLTTSQARRATATRQRRDGSARSWALCSNPICTVKTSTGRHASQRSSASGSAPSCRYARRSPEAMATPSFCTPTSTSSRCGTTRRFRSCCARKHERRTRARRSASIRIDWQVRAAQRSPAQRITVRSSLSANASPSASRVGNSDSGM